MKIASIKTFLVHPHTRQSGWIGSKNCLFLKIETDEDIEGWGEAYTLPDRDKNIVQHVKDLEQFLVGKNPFHIKQFIQMVYNDFAGRRGAMDLFCAQSAIEQALWDIVGKALGSPVYNLLGGPCRKKIRVYANGWYTGVKNSEQLAQRAIDIIKLGFTAVKFDPFPGPWRLFIGKEEEKIAVDNVRAVREAVGPEVDILIEVHRRLAPFCAIRVAKMIEEFSPFWYEEPVPAENLDALAEVKRSSNLPIVTGETLYTKMAFREVLEKRAADILNPDVANCGGILELKEIAAMAEAYYVGIAPHNYNSTTIALAATLQVAATIPNFLITEYFINFSDFGNKICSDQLKVVNGCIALPNTPGLGIEINQEALKEYPYKKMRPRKFHFI